MCAVGAIPSVRFLNSIRIPAHAIDMFGGTG
jgi:hypothetical protein